MLICKTNLHTKNGPLSSLEAEKSTFPPKPDGQTDIGNYRVASLLKILITYFITRMEIGTKLTIKFFSKTNSIKLMT